jgi:hypothetical protein
MTQEKNTKQSSSSRNLRIIMIVIIILILLVVRATQDQKKQLAQDNADNGDKKSLDKPQTEYVSYDSKIILKNALTVLANYMKFGEGFILLDKLKQTEKDEEAFRLIFQISILNIANAKFIFEEGIRSKTDCLVIKSCNDCAVLEIKLGYNLSESTLWQVKANAKRNNTNNFLIAVFYRDDNDYSTARKYIETNSEIRENIVEFDVRTFPTASKLTKDITTDKC